MLRSLLCAPAAAAAVSLAGCQSPSDPASRSLAEGLAPDTQQFALPAPVAATAAAPERARLVPREVAPPADAREVAGWRRDGRPVWWLDEPTIDEGLVTLTAEALGGDIRDARRNAVEAGREAVRRFLDDEEAALEVVTATVRPLRVRSASPRASSFAGYVLVRAALEEAPR